LLSPSDVNIFKEASQRLQEDDSHTIEVRFKLQIKPTMEREPSAGTLYQLMEGKGMLIIDREDGQPSHTMWVIKPIAPPRFEHDTPTVVIPENDLAPEPASTIRPSFLDQSGFEPVTPFPFTQPISKKPILCRICECQIPQWYFEKHSETCVETHRLEAEIVECNESISELRNTIRELGIAIDRPSPVAIPEYRGMQIFLPSSSPVVPSPLQLFRANKMQRLGLKKMQRRLLDQIDEILQVASEISMPSLKEEEANEPIERQRLLSPSSERKITQIRQWSKPNTEDAALTQLIQDAERIMRQKVDNVVRMQNTIRYSEKIWLEWQERVEGTLATVDESSSDSESTSEEEDKKQSAMNDQSGMVSEYDATARQSLEPTPAASQTSISPPTARPASVLLPLASAAAVGSRQQLQATRSATPSSVSSPLARAQPIIAPPSPEEAVPPLSLDDLTAPPTIRSRRSASNLTLLEPKLVITPPASPLVLASRDGNSSSLSREGSTKRKHRRHSTAHALTSPPAAGPLSPRQMSSQPLPRTTPTSIKDFDIIKPISKGAFGSVFLAKKKATGDYYAIKVLKKADMIAKNQITNVKAERMILMKQAESPFVAKLYFTFQSKDNLYLVMEYLNGGDCAALIKSLGSLPEEWTKSYIAEVVLGLEYLHQRGIVHRYLQYFFGTS
jgi:serine/threonine-protein kinase RIM15